MKSSKLILVYIGLFCYLISISIQTSIQNNQLEYGFKKVFKRESGNEPDIDAELDKSEREQLGKIENEEDLEEEKEQDLNESANDIKDDLNEEYNGELDKDAHKENDIKENSENDLVIEQKDEESLIVQESSTKHNHDDDQTIITSEDDFDGEFINEEDEENDENKNNNNTNNNNDTTQEINDADLLTTQKDNNQTDLIQIQTIHSNTSLNQDTDKNLGESLPEETINQVHTISTPTTSKTSTIETTTTESTTTIRTTTSKHLELDIYNSQINLSTSTNQSHINVNCPGLSCEFGYKTDLFGKTLCSCFNPCVEQKCGSKICKIEKLTELKFVAACYDPNQIERPIRCHMPLAIGTCKNYSSRFYYNPFHQRCEHFIYKGCNGNENNFLNWEKCHMECNTCSLPPVKGPCQGNLIRYHYDHSRRACVAFNYGGCKGNENNFFSRKQCEDSCLTRKEGALFLNGMPIRIIRKYHNLKDERN